MQNFLGGNAVFLAIAAFIIICIFLGVRIVPQSQKHVVERLGRLRLSYSPIFGQISGLFKLLPAPADRFQCC